VECKPGGESRYLQVRNTFATIHVYAMPHGAIFLATCILLVQGTLISEGCKICEEHYSKCNEVAYLPSLELRCELQEKLHHVTWPFGNQAYPCFKINEQTRIKKIISP
jgi:hypothetical protein